MTKGLNNLFSSCLSKRVNSWPSLLTFPFLSADAPVQWCIFALGQAPPSSSLGLLSISLVNASSSQTPAVFLYAWYLTLSHADLIPSDLFPLIFVPQGPCISLSLRLSVLSSMSVPLSGWASIAHSHLLPSLIIPASVSLFSLGRYVSLS